MENHPESYSSFYTEKNLGLDLLLVQRGYQQFKPYFKGSTCLELGPATGYMTKNLVKDFEFVTVIEGSESLISQIPDYPNLTKIHSLFEDFDTEHRFDTVIINHVLEHIEQPVSLLRSISKWLSPDGVIILGVPNSKSFHRLAAVKMGLLSTESELNERDKVLGHYRVYDFDLLRKHLREAGLNILAEGGVFLKFLSNHQTVEYLSEEIIEAYFQLGEEFKNNAAEIYVVAQKN